MVARRYALAALGGNRTLSVFKDFSSGIADNLNLLIHGPVVGMTIKF